MDTAALIQALKSGPLGGVALDVYEEEEGLFFEDLSGAVLQDDELSRVRQYPLHRLWGYCCSVPQLVVGSLALRPAQNRDR